MIGMTDGDPTMANTATAVSRGRVGCPNCSINRFSRTLRGSRRWLPCKPTVRKVPSRKNALSLASSFPGGSRYGCQADQPPRLATTQSAEEPINQGQRMGFRRPNQV
jgi:hypothetical protein